MSLKKYTNHRRVLVFSAFLLMLLFFSENSFSQDLPKNQFNIYMGPGLYQLKDKVLNNSRYQGLAASGGIAWFRKAGVFYQVLELSFTYAKVKNRFDYFPSGTALNSSLQYALLAPVGSANGARTFHVGGFMAGNWYLHYLPFWDDSHIYWATMFSAGPVAEYQHKLSKGKIITRMQLPVVSLTSRPPQRFLFKVIDDDAGFIVKHMHQNFGLSSPFSVFLLKWGVDYEISLGRRVSERFFYKGSFLQANVKNSLPLSQAQHAIGISFIF